MTDLQNDGAWFAPKRFGYGAGLPLAWQGWVLLIGHIAAIIACSRWLAHRPGLMTAVTILIAVLPLPLYAAKTRGGWKWRAGGE